jgi:F0F1-type ATP synthase assembly protein I
MPELGSGGHKGDDESLPEVPAIPTLPDVPTLKPDLPHMPKPRGEGATEQQRMGLAYTLPAALIAPIVVLTLTGYWLDNRFHKSPYFTLGGALLGAVTGFMNMIRIANRLNR